MAHLESDRSPGKFLYIADSIRTPASIVSDVTPGDLRGFPVVLQVAVQQNCSISVFHLIQSMQERYLLVRNLPLWFALTELYLSNVCCTSGLILFYRFALNGYFHNSSVKQLRIHPWLILLVKGKQRCHYIARIAQISFHGAINLPKLRICAPRAPSNLENKLISRLFCKRSVNTLNLIYKTLSCIVFLYMWIRP